MNNWKNKYPLSTFSGQTKKELIELIETIIAEEVLKDRMIQREKGVKKLLLQTIKETREEVCKELIPEYIFESELENFTPIEAINWCAGFNACRQEIINKANKLK